MKSIAVFITFIFAVSMIPVVHAQEAGDFEVKDTRGDVSPFGFTPVGLPSSPATDAADILGLRIFDEDIEGLSVELAIANLKPSPEVIRLLSGGQYSVRFMLEGSEIRYTMNFYVFEGRFDPVAGSAPSGIVRIPANFYLCVPTSGCYDQRIIAHVDWDKSLITGYLPKGALAGKEPVYSDEAPAGVPSIRAGSRLSSIQARVFGNFGFSDVVPDSGFAGPYVLRAGVPNEKIGLSLMNYDGGYSYSSTSTIFGPYSDFPEATVTPGTPTLVQVRVSNFNPAKRLINLSAQLVDPADAGKWNVRVVNTLTIPGGDHRIINLIVNATPQVQHRDQSLVRISARSLGFPDEIGSLRLRLVGAVPPTPEKNTLFLHMSDVNSGLGFCLGCGGGYIWMNTLEEDPQAMDAAGMTMGYNFFGLTGTTFLFDAVLDTQLTQDLVFDMAKPITATIVTTCSPCPSGEMSLELRSEEGAIASGSATYGNTVEIDMLPIVDRVPKGSYVGLFGSLQTNSPPPLVDTMNPRIIGSKSQVELPIIPDPDAKAASSRIPLGPAFLTLSADNATGEFIAPGKSKVVAVTIVNEGIEEDVVTIAFEHEPESWHVGLQPGDTYRLKPGESATFGVVVRAPQNASEGEHLSVLLNATSSIDETALAQLGIDLTASENALDDESEFEVDEDTEKALEAQSNKSPGPGAILLVAVAGLVLLLRRRRQ